MYYLSASICKKHLPCLIGHIDGHIDFPHDENFLSVLNE